MTPHPLITELQQAGGLQQMDIQVTQVPTGEFVAIDRNNYDVDCDHTGFFTKSPTGYGRTPLDAIVDLLDNTEEG